MPIRLDDQQRIDRLRADLLDIKLDWNKQYILVDEGPKWSLNFIQPITKEQLLQAKELIETIMNGQ
jgi:hypothetical protein